MIKISILKKQTGKIRWMDNYLRNSRDFRLHWNDEKNSILLNIIF